MNQEAIVFLTPLLLGMLMAFAGVFCFENSKNQIGKLSAMVMAVSGAVVVVASAFAAIRELQVF